MSARAGFTLLEIIVAIGAVAIVTVGLAALFQSIGRTVSVGKKLNLSNTYAVLLEQQMRRDIASMTRDGFLVIRQQAAMGAASGTTNGNPGSRVQIPVKVWAEDPYPRPRRTDELMFFAHGDFRSQRPAINSRVTVTSDTARIYYGHGVRGRADAGTFYTEPELDTEFYPGTNDSFLLGIEDARNRDRYASSWTLLRHVTLLVPGNAPKRVIPKQGWSALGLNANDEELLDSDWQIGFQPAASSIFYPIARQFEASTAAVKTLRKPNGNNGAKGPTFASGLVDIATTDLNELRSWVVDLRRDPKDVKQASDVFDPAKTGAQLVDRLDGKFKSEATAPYGDLKYMQQWMLAAMPTASDPREATSLSGVSNEIGQRIRYEDIGPALLESLRDATVDANGVPLSKGTSALELNYRRADQLMLSAFRFLPRCTEFTVEWSFGQSDKTGTNQGETIWYGSRANATPLPSDPETNLTAWNDEIKFTRYDENDPKLVYEPWKGLKSSLSEAKDHKIPAGLIYANPTGSGTDEYPQTLVFGYVDPSYVNTTAKPNEPENFPATLPCPWPKLLRITATLADSTDPSQSETFQFVFELPGSGNP